MVIISPEPDARGWENGIRLSATAAIVLAFALGLCGGYLDVLIMIAKKFWWNDLGYIWSGRDFLWSVPLVSAVLLLIPALLLAALNGLWPGSVSLRQAAWVLATVAIWGALLRAPLYGACTLFLAAGVGRSISGSVADYVRHPRRERLILAGLLGLLIVLAAATSGREAIREYRARAALPAPPAGARNVLLIVWDTVRSHNLSVHGYPRNTTPNLVRWARQGVRYGHAVAPAPWTYPSHSSFFTGHWPHKLNTQWNMTLDARVPTLAEFLAARGYDTAGFAANTSACSYESGLNRGFVHYEDYPITPLFLLGRTVAGTWIHTNILRRGDFYNEKWTRLQSRDARGITSAFLDWLRPRRKGRPFFAFLNFFDAHDPYLPLPKFAGRFGITPEFPRDYQLLMNFRDVNKENAPERDLYLARDCYDDCIATLDDQFGRLLDELRGQGLLDNTLVVLTSDHGEGFGDHGVFGHGSGVYWEQISVPLVIISPGGPADRLMGKAISLRDLPVTIVDLLGLSAGAPFPGSSLAASWRTKPGETPPETTTAFTEVANRTAFQSQPQRGRKRRGFQMSVVAGGGHYLRDGMGAEQLYDLHGDPFERVNLIGSARGNEVVGVFRRLLLDFLTENPGSIEVESAYLTPYRQLLKALVDDDTAPGTSISALQGPSNQRRQ